MSRSVSEASRFFGLPIAAPNGHAASILLAFLTTAGLFYVNIMPALVSGLVDGLQFSKTTAGYVAAANVYGAALGAFSAVFAISHIGWKKASIVSLSILVMLDLLSSAQTNGDVLIPLRFVHGAVGGFLVGIGFSVIARTDVPDRSFGMLLVVQYGLGGFGLMFLPGLVAGFGTVVLFYALIAFSLVTLCMVPFLASYPPKKKTILSDAENAKSGTLIKPLILALLAVFFFQSANMGLAAFVIELGKSNGLDISAISTTLGIANWIAVLGAILVYVIGLKNGRFTPLLLGLVVSIIGMLLFKFSANETIFFVANVVTGITWAFLIPYLLGMCAAFDGKGQMAALSGFFSKMGLASGPFIAAVLIGDGNYNLIINLAILGIFLCMIAAFVPARLLDSKAEVLIVSIEPTDGKKGFKR